MKVIGIAGPSCSGKSTFASELSKKLNDAPIICLDYQYDCDVPHAYTDGMRSFERPELFHGEELARIVNEIRQKGFCTFTELRDLKKQQRTVAKSEYIILEGFILFHYPEVRKICDFFFYVDVPWSEIYKRRAKRPIFHKADAAFLKVGERDSKTFVEPQKKLPGMVIIDGLKDPELSTQDAVQSIIKH